ncbi:flagellar biosynthetic protein FliR [Carnobacterium inhibens]|uniref:Flagellar biosynthetic protein FliR n=1 Tax=Carnobacterium inhibens subsp. gilichinskyi TaxID=1266845 RepID=U5SEN7_9LACT|nr:flagellar biosynthetic protein FliR [Carnobacterium inhibens]AGY82332.1 flagellar biosynthesis protein FliR [Carnobacterium inhibens subsp. gilichinskyi]
MTIQLQTIILIFIRITAFIVVSPGFSIKGLPSVAKIALSMGITLAAYSAVPVMEQEEATLFFALLVVKEVLVGIAIGFITKLFFSAVEIAGNFVDFQVGFSMGAVYDPSMGINVSYYGKIYYWLSMCVFYMTNLHHIVIKSLVQSFQYMPISSTNIGSFGVEGMMKLLGIIFELAFNLAAPMIIVALLTEVILGLISRSVPQINVLILGMPLKIVASFVIMLILLPTLIKNIQEILPLMVKYMNEFLQSL